ncbi:MAG: glutamate racemase [Clostridia bacterium]|nr:glutamate racemase [Clostridia bacterium]
MFIDSGIGGLSTLAQCLKLCPTLSFVYIADTKNAPYGNRDSAKVASIIKKLISRELSKNNIGLVVLACNTATACAIDELRTQTDIHIIGIEPAILPAINSTNGKILVLATPLTCMQPRFEALCKPFADRLIISPQPTLASLIEAYIADKTPQNLEPIIKVLKLSIKTNPNFSAVVLGCTHYSLIKEIIQSVMNAPVFDGNFGVAREVFRQTINTPSFLSPTKTFPEIKQTGKSKTPYHKLLEQLMNKNF